VGSRSRSQTLCLSPYSSAKPQGIVPTNCLQIALANIALKPLTTAKGRDTVPAFNRSICWVKTLYIIEAKTTDQLDAARDLFREYQAFLGVDLCFQGFEEELAGLPGKYADPGGAILLAQHQGEFIGCVAVRPLKGEICEMKRLYVKPSAQGFSAGRLLAEAIITKAKKLGYQKMQLDTLKRLERALVLYEKLGFNPISPYYANPLDEVVYLQLDFD
jgi:putative acetyltransferase